MKFSFKNPIGRRVSTLLCLVNFSAFFLWVFDKKKTEFPEIELVSRLILFCKKKRYLWLPPFHKKWFFPQNAPRYRALFWLFCPIIHCVFTSKISKKFIFFSNCTYSTGHFIDFSPKKSIFSSICACILSTILTFLTKNPVCFYTKNSKKS